MTSNKDKIILDLCGGTASWSKPYLDAGYTVFNITLPEFDVTRTQFGTDGHIYFYPPKGPGQLNGIDVKKIHGILAAPPCTMFSIARTHRAIKPRDFNEGMAVVRACMEIIWYCRANGNLEWWALENPTGYLRQFLGNPPLRFEQWMYGDQGIKPTDIWGYYRVPTKPNKTRTLLAQSKEQTKIYSRYGHRKAAELYAMTPPGFANAFFKVNP